MCSREDVLRDWERCFVEQGVDSPRLSAQVLLAHVLGLSRLEMLLSVRKPLSSSDVAVMGQLAQRRMHGEPVAYIVGCKEFYGLEFRVSPAVLIPRPETEILVDYLCEHFRSGCSQTLLDIGTGSGALAVTCAHLFPSFQVLATDISLSALHIARDNARRHGARVSFIQSNLLNALRLAPADIILANLPYVPELRRGDLSPEVRDYEPSSALFAGADGLDCYRVLAADLSRQARAGTTLLCEIDHTQGHEMTRLFSSRAASVRIFQDYAGFDRVVVVVF